MYEGNDLIQSQFKNTGCDCYSKLRNYKPKKTYQSFFLCRLDLVRLRRLCLFIFKRRFFLRLPILYFDMMFVEIEKRPVPSSIDDTGHKTGNNLLSHSSEAALPSATEGLTSVFGMETCVSPRL